jgi:hypothetical protein
VDDPGGICVFGVFGWIMSKLFFEPVSIALASASGVVVASATDAKECQSRRQDGEREQPVCE